MFAHEIFQRLHQSSAKAQEAAHFQAVADAAQLVLQRSPPGQGGQLRRRLELRLQQMRRSVPTQLLKCSPTCSDLPHTHACSTHLACSMLTGSKQILELLASCAEAQDQRKAQRAEWDAARLRLERMRQQDPDNLPGRLRPRGPRHSNDNADFACISIMPTQDELLCQERPYLPANRCLRVSCAPLPQLGLHPRTRTKTHAGLAACPTWMTSP